MHTVLRFSALLGLIASGLSLHAAAPSADDLRLVATINGISTTHLTTRDGELVPLLDTGPAPASEAPSWSLEGEVLVHPELLYFSPDYSVRQNPVEEFSSGREGVAVATISWLTSENEWPYRDVPHGALLVVAWMLNDRPVKVSAVFLQPLKDAPNKPGVVHTKLEITFPLSRNQVAGFPVILLRAKNDWIEQRPYSGHTQFQQALIAMYRHDSAAFDHALDLLKEIDALPGGARASLLTLAAEAGLLDAVDVLSRRGANAEQFRAFRRSVRHGHAPVVARFLAFEKADDMGVGGGDELFREALDNEWPNIAWMLLAAHAEGTPDARRAADISLHAMKVADLNTMRQISAASGPDIFAQSDPRLISTAASKRDPEYVHLVLKGGADVNASSEGFAPLAVAAALDRVESMREILQAGAAVDQRGKDGVTALFAAVQLSRTQAVQLLLDAGADPNIGDDQGNTPLLDCVAKDNVALAAHLVERGARPDAGNPGGETPLTLALRRRATSLVDLFVAKGSRLPINSREFPIFLEQCLASDQVVLVQRAVEDGWDPASRIRKVWPAWQVADLWGARSCAAWLQIQTAQIPGLSIRDLKEATRQPKALSISLGTDARFFSPAHLASGVELSGVIGPDGTLIFAQIERSPHSHLTKLVMDAIGGWTFQPAMINREVVPVRARIAVSFVTDKKRKENPRAGTVQLTQHVVP